MMFLLVIGIGLITVEIEICKARDFKTDVVIALENSNYHPDVINAWKERAGQSGYQLTITPYEKEGCVEMAEVILDYSYQISPFHEKETHRIRGYAR